MLFRSNAGSAAGAARLTLVIDLLALEDLPISFEAQTQFYRFMTEADQSTSRPYQPLVQRFGFTREAFSAPGTRHSALG